MCAIKTSYFKVNIILHELTSHQRQGKLRLRYDTVNFTTTLTVRVAPKHPLYLFIMLWVSYCSRYHNVLDIIMFAIGIGSEINQAELEGIASPPVDGTSFVLNALGFDALPNLVSQLLPSTCEAIIGL